MIDRKKIDQLFKNDLRTYNNIGNIVTNQKDDYK